jgi:hypothetical protein
MISRTLIKSRQILVTNKRCYTRQEILAMNRKNQSWLDVSCFRRNGKSSNGTFENQPLVHKDEAVTFPRIGGMSLNLNEIHIPDDFPAHVKLVGASFQEYGMSCVRTWIDPFTAHYPSVSTKMRKVTTLELSFVEYKFLHVLRNSFATNIKKMLPEDRADFTAITFGGVNVSFHFISSFFINLFFFFHFPLLCRILAMHFHSHINSQVMFYF